MNNGKDRLEMGTGGNFRDNTAVIFKNIDLGGDDIAQDSIAVFNNSGASVVARGFDAKDF